VQQIPAKARGQATVEKQIDASEDAISQRYLHPAGAMTLSIPIWGGTHVQRRKKRPAHIVLHGIHMKKEEIGALLHHGAHGSNADPHVLTK